MHAINGIVQRIRIKRVMWTVEHPGHVWNIMLLASIGNLWKKTKAV
jgi:hypothetical protein